jgi:hypothetical protein
VIGGAPAAGVVFVREVDSRTDTDPRVAALRERVTAGNGTAFRAELHEMRSRVRAEKLGEVAAEFEAVHDIERARRVGSVHDIIPAAELRPRLIASVEAGMERAARSTGG